MAMAYLFRLTLIAVVAGVGLMAGHAQASDSRQGTTPRQPITAANASDVVAYGVVAKADFPVEQVAWLPDDALLALTRDQARAQTQPLVPGPLLGSFPVTVWAAEALAVAPAGDRIAALRANAAGDGFTLSVDGQGEAASFEIAFLGPPGAVAFSPDGSQIAAGPGVLGPDATETPIYLVDAATGKATVLTLPVAKGVWDLAFAPDGDSLALALGALDVRVWSVAEQRKVREWNDAAWFVPVVVAHSGVVVAASQTGLIPELYAWDTVTGLERWQAHPGHIVLDLAFNPAGDVLAAALQDGAIELWDAVTGTRLHTLVEPEEGVRATSVAFSADGAFLVSGSGTEDAQAGAIWLWGLPDPRYLGPPVQAGPGAGPGSGSGSGPGSGMVPGGEEGVPGPPQAGGGPGDDTYPLDPPGPTE